MNFLFALSLVFALIRLLVTLFNFISRPVLHYRIRKEQQWFLQQPDPPFISILVPCRNEEFRISFLLESILNQPYNNYELIILNDNSTDRTAEVIEQYRTKLPRLQLIHGEPLPSQWIGKNWACHQLSMRAHGKFMLFLDADVTLKGEVIQKSVFMASRYQLSLFSLFPEQIMISNGEKITVPVMHYILLSLLPLDFVYKFYPASLAAANGQFMLFESSLYLKHRFHFTCRQEVLEDVKIMQQVKKEGLRGMVMLGNGLVYCRMYVSYANALEGFSKNFLAGFGKSRTGLLAFLFFTILIPAVMLFKSPYVGLLYVLIALIIRLLSSVTSKQSILNNLLFHPQQMISVVIISIRAIAGSFLKRTEWKGRVIS